MENKILPWAKPYFGQEEIQAVIKCMESGWISMGNKVKEYEDNFSTKLKTNYSIAVNSGTAALDIALKVLGIKPGDEIIIPSFTYIATANSVLYQGAIPVFADINDRTFNIDPTEIDKKITDKTKAVICIDYGGNPADYEKIRAVINGKSIFLVEDGAPGLGSKYKDKYCCTLGDISTTSFHSAKIMTTVEGGMIFTENEDWANQCKIIRSQGESPSKKYYHPRLGHNYRMTDINASIGLVQLKKLDEILKKRKDLAKYYAKSLSNYSEKINFIKIKEENENSWFLYPILINNRNKVRDKLLEKRIQTNISWPTPVYKNDHLLSYFHETCPKAEKICDQILCLPLYHNMTLDEQDYIIESLLSVLI